MCTVERVLVSVFVVPDDHERLVARARPEKAKWRRSGVEFGGRKLEPR
jgi:hypothetical protein